MCDNTSLIKAIGMDGLRQALDDAAETARGILIIL